MLLNFSSAYLKHLFISESKSGERRLDLPALLLPQPQKIVEGRLDLSLLHSTFFYSWQTSLWTGCQGGKGHLRYATEGTSRSESSGFGACYAKMLCPLDKYFSTKPGFREYCHIANFYFEYREIRNRELTIFFSFNCKNSNTSLQHTHNPPPHTQTYTLCIRYSSRC